MTSTRPVPDTSIPFYSHCLEKKMASVVGNRAASDTATNAKGGLIHGKFDVEELLAELTVEEKASLLAGNVSTNRHNCYLSLTLYRKGLLAHYRYS